LQEPIKILMSVPIRSDLKNLIQPQDVSSFAQLILPKLDRLPEQP
jgi:hypothetical protein